MNANISRVHYHLRIQLLFTEVLNAIAAQYVCALSESTSVHSDNQTLDHCEIVGMLSVSWPMNEYEE